MKTLMISAALLCLSGTGFAHTLSDIERASDRIDLVSLQQYSKDAESDYALAYANYRLAVVSSIMGQQEQAKQALKQAAVLLQEQLQEQPDAERHALLAAVYGMQIGVESSSDLATLGKKVERHLTQAEELAADNPRVKLVQGMSAFYTPPAFGGDAKKAKRHMQEAVRLFEQPCSNICWGHAEAYTWLGMFQLQEGNTDAARQHWQQALQVNPDYGWAQYMLAQQ
ncbi:hypothetical protein CWE09_11955 [Aliidiomarina minuta]|uniref:Uncharacterized protein n=1 Tax=Aliidiomarina minuta TaxID=880057 RepID=A0A432W3C1_9GAMM|nr:tetratricopeptide repeat protein [Aliidiomarina minuta]RUO23860.1 hypothetical protein CWE09_11955 [Aliidiomarina minuta]